MNYKLFGLSSHAMESLPIEPRLCEHEIRVTLQTGARRRVRVSPGLQAKTSSIEHIQVLLQSPRSLRPCCSRIFRNTSVSITIAVVYTITQRWDSLTISTRMTVRKYLSSPTPQVSLFPNISNKSLQSTGPLNPRSAPRILHRKRRARETIRRSEIKSRG